METDNVTSRGPGRPRQQREVGQPPRSASEAILPKTDKKGTPARWKQGGKMAYLKVPQGFTGRWCHDDALNIEKKLEEGWVFVNRTNAPQGKQVGNDAPDGAYDGAASSSAVKYRDMVGMMLPIEDINGTGQCLTERQKWIEEKNEHAIRSRINLSKEKASGGDKERFAKRFKESTLTIE